MAKKKLNQIDTINVIPAKAGIQSLKQLFAILSKLNIVGINE